MTREELIKWGRKEDKLRANEIASIHSENDLKMAQDAAKKRRRVVGLSASQAALAVSLAQKAKRRGKRNDRRGYQYKVKELGE